MPYVQNGNQIPIPFGGRSPRARAASLSGARVCRAGSQAARLLVAYLTYGPMTDLEAAARVNLPESRVSARRNGLTARWLVAYVDDVPGPYGAINGRYGLTPGGVTVARELARSL